MLSQRDLYSTITIRQGKEYLTTVVKPCECKSSISMNNIHVLFLMVCVFLRTTLLLESHFIYDLRNVLCHVLNFCIKTLLLNTGLLFLRGKTKVITRI